MDARNPPRSVQARLIALLRAASIEIAAKPALAKPLRRAFGPGAEIFINLPPAGDYRAVVETAVAIRHAGFRPVAHVAARNLASLAELDDYLARLVGEAGVDRVLLISGDRRQARGPFPSVVELLDSGRIAAAGIRAVGLAGHVEGDGVAEAAARDRALVAKIDVAARAGLACFIVTQFCFDAAPILAFLDRVERLGIVAPVKVGVAAPAPVATLIRFAERCGVGQSLDTLRRQAGAAGGTTGDSGPDTLLRNLAVGLAERPSDGVGGIHLYTFAGVAKAADWLAAARAELGAAP